MTHTVKIILWLSFGGSALGVLAKVLSLSVMKYPRTLSYQPWEDVVALIAGLLWCMAVLMLLCA